MKKKEKRVKARQGKLNNRGFTLAEMIVSFALTGLFMVAAGKVIVNTTMVYYEAKGITNGMQVSSVLSAKIGSEIESASADDEIVVGTDHDQIALSDAGGTPIVIGTNADGYLSIHYDAGADEDKSNWTFDKKTYMGYTIKELTFSQPKGDYANNIIYMSLTLTSPKYGDYSVGKYIECYNFDAETDQIKTEGE